MITANEKMLIVEMTCLRMSLAAKARVQTEMDGLSLQVHPHISQ